MEINNTHNPNPNNNNNQSCRDYMQALEQERCKILVFQRELPLSLELVTQAIESCKQKLSGITATTECDLQKKQSSECSEQTSSDAPVLEEFIPITKRSSFHSDCDEEQQSKKSKNKDETNVIDKEGQNGNNNNIDDDGDKNIKKSDWLRSVQLWNQSPDPPSKEDDSPKKVEVKKSGGAGASFYPFNKYKNIAPPVENPMPPVSISSTVGPARGKYEKVEFKKSGGGSAFFYSFNKYENVAPTVEIPVPPMSISSMMATGGGGNKEEKDGQSRKARRSWSPELHKRFLQALQQLGGSHRATPKQIRELMKVNGLTNDEVKSHLQKYRLHTRRPSATTSNQNTTNTKAPKLVMMNGGLWMPPEYSVPTTTTTVRSGDAASNGIYASIASLPPPFRETSASSKKNQHNTSNFNDRDSHSERRSSPATSSSTHTTPVY